MIEENVNEVSKLSVNDFYLGLSARVSGYNAKLLLSSALVGCGVVQNDVEHQSPLLTNDAKSICLELIKKGGPAFQVGRDLYKQI